MRLRSFNRPLYDYGSAYDFGGFPTRPLQSEWDSPVERSLLTDQPWPGEWDSFEKVRGGLSDEQRAALRRRITRLTASWFVTVENKQELVDIWELLGDGR